MTNLQITIETTDKEIEDQQVEDFITAWNKICVYGGKTSLERIEREMAIYHHGEADYLEQLAIEREANYLEQLAIEREMAIHYNAEETI